MSEEAQQQAQPDEEAPIFTGSPYDDGLFAAIMGDALTGASTPSAAEGAEEADPAADGSGQQPAADEGAGAGGDGGGAPAEGDAGQPAVPQPGADADAAGGSGEPAGDAPDAESRAGDWATYATAITESAAQADRTEALNAVREERQNYFAALELPARALIGQKLPALRDDEPGRDADGMIVLRDSTEVQEWKDELKHILAEEISIRESKIAEAHVEDVRVLNDSIELFRNNTDIIPGTKQYDTELAQQFGVITKDYQVRNADGKFIGFSVPVQPLLNNLRNQLTATRAAAASDQTAAARAALAEKRQQKAAADPPQEGIGSSAGNSGDGPDDWSAFWNTLDS